MKVFSCVMSLSLTSVGILDLKVRAYLGCFVYNTNKLNEHQ